MTRDEILAKSRKDYEREDDLHKEIARKNQRKADIGEGFLLLLLVLTNHSLGGPKQVSQIFWMLLWYKNASINMINGYTDKTPGVFGFGALFLIPLGICFCRFVTGLL